MDQMLRRLSPEQLEEWRHVFTTEMFGHSRDDMHTAMIIATMLNINRKRGSSAVTTASIMDMMPHFPTDAPTDDVAENERRTAGAVAFVERLNVLYGGADIRAERGTPS